MARADYFGCAVCDGKAFYDGTDAVADWAEESGGKVVALCCECAKTHALVVQTTGAEGD